MSDKLALTNAALEAPKNLKEVFEIEAFKYNFTNNYLKTTGRPDGAIIFEREKILFMKALQENPKLQECTRFSIYSACIELAASGLTLAEGISYILPYGKVAQFQIGYKGRLEQINTIPGIEIAPEPQVVWTGDEFDYELGETPKIIKHKPIASTQRAKNAIIEWVYLVLTLSGGGKRITLLDRATVIARRDRYSKTYQYWIKAGGEHDERGNVTKPAKRSGSNGEYVLDPPFPVTNPEKYFKKTVVKAAYDFLPKTARMKALDERIQYNLDTETGEVKDTEKIDYGIGHDQQNNTVETRHEVVNDTPNQQQGGNKPDLGKVDDEF